MYLIEFSEEAELDGDQTTAYYDSLSPNLGLRFLEEVYAFVMAIQLNPTSFHTYEKKRKIRRCNLKNFPYAIYYTVEGEKISLLAILNQRRSANFVRNRLK